MTGDYAGFVRAGECRIFGVSERILPKHEKGAFGRFGAPSLRCSIRQARQGRCGTDPKTFIVLFLTFWYVVVNDGGKTKSLDFAGFYGTPATGVIVMYAAIKRSPSSS
jgi:hypothetical protein